MAFRFNNTKNNVALQLTVGTTVEGNAITATKSFNLIQDVKDESGYEDVLSNFALAVQAVQEHTITAIYHNATDQLEASVGGGK